MNYLSLNQYLKESFGTKVYKLAIDGGFTCPNRDGTLGVRGCIFCSGFGSGDFAKRECGNVTNQIEAAKSLVSRKIKDGKYIAYFQSFTNTYAPVNVLRQKFYEAINHPDVVAISIGTRPDCLDEEILNLLEELNKVKPVWVELGLQTIHEKSADFIRRGYKLPIYDRAVYELKARNIYVITHVILGLPGESKEMMLDTVRYVCSKRCHDKNDSSSNIPNGSLIPATDGIKLQLLHIIKGTDLATLYEYYSLGNTSFYNICNDFERDMIDKSQEIMRDFRCMELTEYADLIRSCIEIIPSNIAIHRMTGDGDKRTLLAPLWSGDKKRVLNTITLALRD